VLTAVALFAVPSPYVCGCQLLLRMASNHSFLAKADRSLGKRGHRQHMTDKHKIEITAANCP
jgi:hypothetical protein